MTNVDPGTLTQILKSLEETKGAITNLRGQVEPFFISIRTELISIRTELQELRATTERLGATTERLGADQVKIRGEIMSRIDRLQESIELVRNDACVNWATADTAIHRARNSHQDIDDLQKQITAMERRYQTLISLVDELRKPVTKKPHEQ